MPRVLGTSRNLLGDCEPEVNTSSFLPSLARCWHRSLMKKVSLYPGSRQKQNLILPIRRSEHGSIRGC